MMNEKKKKHVYYKNTISKLVNFWNIIHIHRLKKQLFATLQFYVQYFHKYHVISINTLFSFFELRFNSDTS